MAADSIVGTDQAYDQVIYQFSSASEASAFVAGISVAGGPVPVVHRAGERQHGHVHALKATPGDSVGRAAHRRAAADRDGVRVRADPRHAVQSPAGWTCSSSPGSGWAPGAPAVPAKETIIYNLMKRQAAAAVLG